MITSAVEQEDRLLLPFGIFSIELLHQVLHEDEHQVAVRVGVREREVHSAVGIQRSDQRQPGIHCLLDHRSCRIGRTPHLPGEVGLVEPAFVDIDTPCPFPQQVEHSYRVLLAEDEATFRV